jgi:hypothetical protein
VTAAAREAAYPLGGVALAMTPDGLEYWTNEAAEAHRHAEDGSDLAADWRGKSGRRSRSGVLEC